MSSFADLNLHERLIKALGELEITTPTPVQTAAIPAALEGRDLRVVARTGSGTRSMMCSPYPSSPTRLAGLLVSRRIDRTPRSTRICAPIP